MLCEHSVSAPSLAFARKLTRAARDYRRYSLTRRCQLIERFRECLRDIRIGVWVEEVSAYSIGYHQHLPRAKSLCQSLCKLAYRQRGSVRVLWIRIVTEQIRLSEIALEHPVSRKE